MIYNISLKILTKILFALIILGCSKNTSKIDLPRKNNALSIIKKRIKEHGKICFYVDEYKECSKEMVARVKLDSLDLTSTNLINNFINKMQPSYPKTTEFVLIRYYPGKDINNSSGSASKDLIGELNLKVVQKINTLQNTTLLNVYKNNEGLERWTKNLIWVKDDDHVISKTFFQQHYPGESYVILHSSGSYYSYYGEYPIEQQIEDIDLFISLVESKK